MNYFNQLLPNELVYSLGWTIFHSIWQGILSASIILIGFLFAEKNNSKIRYGIATASLFFFLFCTIITFVYHFEKISMATTTSVAAENSTTAARKLEKHIRKQFAVDCNALVCGNVFVHPKNQRRNIFSAQDEKRWIG